MNFCRVGFNNLRDHVAIIASNVYTEGKAVLDYTTLNVVASMYLLLSKQNDDTR